MTSVEKRRSRRKSGGHRRKHSDGGYSDTSSSGSFLDETDREVSNLTDRAFRSLCIGDEAVYNDSDLCSSSPCSQRDKQLAFGQNREDREREELKRAAHESFRLRVQQYEQDWVHGGMSGAEICRDPHWETHGEMTQGRVSATFQHSFVESAQREQSLREEQLSFLSNGATELSSQQRRSRSRVSSLIRTFNSDSQGDGAWTDGKVRERYNGNSWDTTALMSIQRELSEFSNSYQQNFTRDNFPTADPFFSRNANLYSAAVSHVNSAPSFTSASHSMFNCNSNFFIHSEFSPFKVWTDHNRFPFQQEQVSGFSHHSEIPKWYETPMYKELSQEAQPQGSYRFKERGVGYSRNNLLPVVPPSPPRSTSMVLQKALAVEKRCESELMGQYTHRKRTQSLGTKRLPTQRPSTASPTTEMSRRVQETISSVKALQQKIKKMTAQNMDTGMTANQQGALCSEDDLISYGHNALTWAPNVVRSNTTPLNISQRLTPSGRTRQEAAATVQQCAASPQPVEHPPVRAESRGATPDIRMSSYRSRATSLLFNLKDNRKRVKNTYSPTKFKNSEMPEKSKHPSAQEPRDTVIDIPDFPDPDIQFTHAASHQYVQQYQNPGLSFAAQNPCPRTAHAGQYPEYQTAEKQAEMFCHSTFTGVTPENYTATQLANGQNPHEDLLSLSSYQYGTTDNVESLRGGVYGLNASYTAADTQKHTANNQTGDYFRSNANAEQYFNETVEREFTKVERYQQPKDNKHDYSNVFSQERWRNEQDAEKLISPWKQEITALIERDQHSQAYQRAAVIKEEHNLTRDKYRGNNLNLNKEVDKLDFEQSFVMGTSHKSPGYINPNISKQPQCPPIMNHDAVENRTYYGQQQQQQQPGTIRDKHVLQKYYGNNDNKETNQDNSLTQNSNRHTDQDYRNQHALYSNKDKTMFVEETGQRKQHMPVPEGHKMQCLQQIQATPQFEHNVQKNPLSTFENAAAPSTAAPAKERQFSEVKAAQATTEQHTQAELAKAQHQAQVEQPNAESARLILAGQTGSEEVKAEQARAEPSECERVKLTQAEPFKDKTRNEEQTEQSEEKHLEQARKDETKVKQTREQKGTEKPRDITEEAGATHMKNEQGEQVNAEQAEVDKLKEEHIKTELEQTEQAGILTARANVQKVEEKQVRVEQIEIEQKNTKQIETENIKAEQVENEQRKDDKANHELMKEQKAKTEQLKIKEDEKVKVDQIKLEDVRAKPKEDSNQAGHVNTEQPTTQLRTTREAKTEAQTNVVAKPELPKTVDLYEKFVKPGSNTKVTQQVKGQPDRVEQVKTELAKAKAELAKIKEKMRGEQKGKVKTTVVTDDITKKDDPLKVHVNKSEDFKKKDQETQSDQKKRDSIVNKYDDVREKQDFTNAVSTNGNKSASGDDNETSTLSLSGAETVTNNKSNDKHSPKSGLATTNTENKEEVIGFKGNDLSEGHYVYSESSKEFKLLSSSYSPTNVDNKGNRDTVTDKENDGDVEKLEKCEAAKHTDISQPRNSDSRKHDPLERKHRSTDHSSVSAKDLHFTPPRALSQKERAQAKQEILTSKIKAHAEKEISAIKEKGLRDGLLSKNSNKQLAGSQSISIRQRPPIQEVSKKHESTASSNNTPKHQIEPAGIQSVSPASSAATPVMSALTTAQLVDSSQKQAPKEPVKSNNNVLVSTTNTKQTGCSTTITNLAENQVKKNQSGVKSPVQSKEQAINDNQAKQEPKRDANSGKQKEESSENSDHRNEKKNDSSQATALVKVPTTENPEIKHEAVPEDSAPTLNLVLQDQNTTAMVDDSLQIMGIMVIVRERKPPETNGERDNSAQESMNTKKKGGSNSKLSQLSKENESSADGNTAKTSNRAVQEMCPTEKEDQAKMNPPEIVPETLSERKNKESEQKANLQESSSVNTKYQRETQLQKPMTEKSAPAIVTAPAKNKVLAETQPLLSKQGIIEGSTNDPSDKIPKENSAKSTMKEEEAINPGKTQTAHDAFMANVDHTGTDFKMNSGRTDAESLKDDVHLSSAKDMTTSINPSKSWNIDGKSAPLLDEKRQDSTQLRPFNEGPSPSQSLNDNQNSVTPKLQHKETFTEKKSQVDDVHIDSIAIRVVPSVTQEDKQDIAGKLCVTVVPSDAVKATELHEVAPPRREERANTSNNDHRIKDLALANSDRQVEDKLGVQHVLASVRKLSDSLKNSKQPSNTNGTQTGNGKPEKVKEREEPVVESKLKATEGDYFQVQGAEETNDEPHANDGETLDGASKGGGLPGSLPNKTPVSNKPYKELQYEAFVLDPSIKKTLESSQIKVQDENMEKKNWETEDKLASKQTDTPTERQNSSEKMKNGKQHTVSQSSLSARESQSSRTSDQTRNNAVSEKPGVKPKLKSSTIPEISAIADYARLKVIVSEEQESTIQEFPPKKEGFFPLIQSRHSRRPVFTLDPKEFPVKEKKMPTKTEMSAKVNKEPKALVFPITEKEHQRTGMFKLGDKEKQEKMVSETHGVSDAGAKHTHCLKERMKSPTTLSKNQGCEEQQVRTDAQRQVDQSHLQTIFSSAADNRPRNTSASQHLMSPVNFNAGEKHEEHKDDSRTPRNAEPFDHKLVKRREERKEKPSQEGFATQHDKTTAKEEASHLEKEKRAEETMKKRIIEESRASLAEEERRSAQREEERRAKEREAIALRIKERREKLRESDKRAEEERRAKQMKEHRAAPKEEETRAKLRKVRETERTKTEEDRRAKLRREEEQLKENEKKRLKQREERAAQEEQQRRAALEKQRLAVQAEQQRRSAQEEQQSSVQAEQQRRSAQEEQQRRSAQEEQQRSVQEEQQRSVQEEQQRSVQAEQQRRSAREEQQRRSAQEEQQRRSAQEEQQRSVQAEQQRRSAREEQQRRSAQEEQQRSVQAEQQRRSAQEEQQRRSAQEEQQRSVQAEQQRRSAQEEQQRRSAQEEQQRRSAQEEQQRRAEQEEQQRRSVHEEQQQRAAREDQRRRTAQDEQQRRSAQEEQQRRAVHEEQQQRRAAQEKQQQRAAQEEQQKRSAHEEQQRQALQEEHQRRAELEKQKLVAHEEQQRRAAQEEQQRRAAHEEQQRRTAQEEEQRTAAQEEHQGRAELEKQKIAAQEDQQKRSAHEEQQRRAARRDAQQELQIRAAQEEQQKRDALIEEQKQVDQTKEKILAEIWEERKRAQGGEEDRKAVEKEKTAAKQKVEKQAKEERSVQLEDIKAEGESQVARERLTQREDEIKYTTSEEDEKFAALRKTERATEVEEQRKAAQMTDALQYYAINSTESERKTKERQVCSPFPSQQKHNPPECESTEDSGTYTRHYRTHGSASPAPRSNTSSPALGAKPSMFRVKDNTIRGSSFIKPVKPRFHKNFGEDFRVGSPIERVSERGEEEQEVIRHGADSRSNRLAVIKEFSSSQPASSSQDYSAYQPQHRPYSRRSIALDEDDSRSVISNMSEGVESFATSATDLADVRSLYDYERPESACSFSSDMSRSMGKPPTVPPKSDKAMQRAKRLTTRRINKELCKAKEDKHEKPPQEVSRVPPSSSNEVHHSNRHVVASPHFSSPISLAHAPVSTPTSDTEHPSSHHPVQASPNATGASSLPIASPHVTASVTLPVASSNPTSPVSNNAVLQTVPHVSSSPTLHHATLPAPVTQYHVESSYPQSYPFTQRKVLQDLGSGQYFVVDVPVQVKTKTFFDPETGKYVQLNVRESGQSNSRPQAQQTYQQPQLQSQMRVKSQHPHSQASPAGKPIMLYQGYHGYPQGYQHAAINSAPPNGSSTPLSLHQNQQPVRDNHSYGCPTSEVRENTEGHCYSPEKTPYMDTVNDTEKTYNTLYNTHGSYEAFPECDTNSQLAGSSVCENDNSAHTRYQPRDIITMGELEDFMEASDW